MTVHDAIRDVSEDVGAIAKERQAPGQIGGYKFRGIDDVLDALHQPLIANGLTILPKVQSTTIDVRDRQQGVWRMVTLEVSYKLTGPEGDSDTAGPFTGEGGDTGDKAANKASSAAYKQMAVQVFCIPVTGVAVDSEADAPAAELEPTPSIQGSPSQPSEAGHGPHPERTVNGTQQSTFMALFAELPTELQPAIKKDFAEEYDCKLKDLPRDQFDEAMAWLQARVDGASENATPVEGPDGDGAGASSAPKDES